MKRIAFTVIAAAMMITGLSAAPSHAGPYAGSVGTTTIAAIGANARVGGTAAVKVRVVARSGNARVKGKIQVRCAGPRGAFKSASWKSYTGPAAKSTRTPTLTRRGTWKCKVYFSYGSVFRGSASTPHYVRVR